MLNLWVGVVFCAAAHGRPAQDGRPPKHNEPLVRVGVFILQTVQSPVNICFPNTYIAMRRCARSRERVDCRPESNIRHQVKQAIRTHGGLCRNEALLHTHTGFDLFGLIYFDCQRSITRESPGGLSIYLTLSGPPTDGTWELWSGAQIRALFWGCCVIKFMKKVSTTHAAVSICGDKSTALDRNNRSCVSLRNNRGEKYLHNFSNPSLICLTFAPLSPVAPLESNDCAPLFCKGTKLTKTDLHKLYAQFPPMQLLHTEIEMHSVLAPSWGEFPFTNFLSLEEAF